MARQTAGHPGRVVAASRVHALAYPLGGQFHIPHGISNALMLEPVLRFNSKTAAPLYAELARAMGVQLGGDEDSQSEAFLDLMRSLLNRTGRRVGCGT
ncbi:iron-containing alcohol dehydrogenase [Sinorhizobium meliloti]|nr:iron-containing alcohol dehydrogenase [Sinorhizobium meliloti]MQW30124.1 iron-containing alcohol dehydrogenase [Sinorhizobium meliloti]